MEKRSVRPGDYDTAADGLWTLAALDFPEPDQETNMVQVPGRTKGPLDLSAILTEGEPCYGSRSLSITLESSEGDREARQVRISNMINRLHGRRVDIVLPDHPQHYVTGRLSVKQSYTDLAHAAVEVSGTCEPWLYSAEETQVVLQATSSEQVAHLTNSGAMTVVPVLEVTAEAGQNILLKYGTASGSFSAGIYSWPTLWLTPGEHEVTYSGAGIMTIKYREAVLR